MLKKLLELLALYLKLGESSSEPEDKGNAGETDKLEDTETDTAPDETAADDLESLIDTAEDELPDNKEADPEGRDKGGRENAAIRDARKRAQDAEDARIRAEATLEAERRIRQERPSSGQTEEQRLWAEEDERLKDPNIDKLERWQIESNRTLRATTTRANNALNQAAEMQDKTAFERLAMSNPKVYDRYKDKVETALTNMRQQGQNAPRLALLRFLIGDDMMNGKLKVPVKTKTQPTC
jgi:hypothetical protein